MEAPSDDAPAADPVRFRPGRKRKAYRQRADDEADDTGIKVAAQPPQALSPSAATADVHMNDAGQGHHEGDRDEQDQDGNGDEESAVAAALRLRNARRGRLRGVGFKSDARPDEAAEEHALILRQNEDRDLSLPGITDRFMHQTGLISNLNDEHMTAYIESRLSSRKALADPPSQLDSSSSAANPTGASATEAGRGGSGGGGVPTNLRDQPTKQGRLLEVDVPANTGNHNAQGHAEAGRKRGAEQGASASAKPSRRQRNRRNSDDVKRDKFIEDFLHENRLEVYDVPAPSAIDAGSGDGDADERLAEQFKQQYYDDVAARRRKKRAPVPTRPAPTESVLKGPKLGGSRNARAAVRDALLLKQEQGKGGRP